jgi:hypothetical protein
MEPTIKTRINLGDVRHGIKRAWSFYQGEIIASAGLAIILTVITVLGGSPVWLGVVLAASNVANLGRILFGQVLDARASRDIDTYINGLTSAPRPSWGVDEEELYDWRKELLRTHKPESVTTDTQPMPPVVSPAL